MDEFLFDEPELPDLADDSGDDEETDEGEELTLLSLSEQAAWIAGVIARHYEREGLTGPDDEFSGEWHALFDQEWQGLSEADSPDFARDAAGENGGVGEGSGADGGAMSYQTSIAVYSRGL